MKKSNHTEVRAKWFLAQEFILEVSGRVVAIGLFPNDEIQLLVPPEIPNPTPEQKISIGPISIMLNCAGVADSHTVHFRLVSPGGSVFETSMQNGSSAKSESHNFILALSGFPLDGFGEFRVIADSDSLGIHSEYAFEVKRVTPPLAAQVPDIQPSHSALPAPKLAGVLGKRPAKNGGSKASVKTQASKSKRTSDRATPRPKKDR